MKSVSHRFPFATVRPASGIAAALLCGVLALPGCGGGGGGSDSGSSPAPGPADTTPPVTAPPPTDNTPTPPVTPPAPVAAPTLQNGPRDATVTAAQPVTFVVYPNASAPLSYQWQRNGVDIPGATQNSYTHIAHIDENRSEYRVRVSTAGGSVTSDAATLTVLSARAGTATLLAGEIGGHGNLDGVGTAARFAGPFGLAVDAAGSVLVADGKLRKVTPSGAVSDALSDGAFGSGVVSVALDAAGHRFVVSNTSAGSLFISGVSRIDPNGSATALSTAFIKAYALTVDAQGNVVVSDALTHSIKKVAPDGTTTLLAGDDRQPGSSDGTGSAARFDTPAGLATDAAGNVFVADYDNDSIRKITAAGVVTTPVPATAGLKKPIAVVVDRASGDLLIADSGNHVIRRVTQAGTLTTVAGALGSAGSADGPAAQARFADLRALAFGPNGALYIADNAALRRLDPSGTVTTVAGLPEPLAPVFDPYQASDAAGNVYIAQRTGTGPDTSYALQKISASLGSATTLATGLSNPRGIAVDDAGSHVYVADLKQVCTQPSSCSAFGVLLKIGVADRRVTTLAGSLTPGSPATLSSVQGVALDAAGNVYLGSEGSILKVAPDGTVSPIAVNYAALIPASSSVGYLSDLAIDKATGTIHTYACVTPPFFRQPSPYTQLVRIDAQGNLAPYGILSGCVRGGLGIDAAGNLFVADTSNHVVRMLPPDGSVRTVAGRSDLQGIALGALPASLSAPLDVSFDGAGNMYVGSAHAVIKVRFDE